MVEKSNNLRNYNRRPHWTRPNNASRNARGPPYEPYRQERHPAYPQTNHETRDYQPGQYDYYRSRDRSPGPYYHNVPREGRGPPNVPYRPRERSPIYTQNYYAPLRDLRDTDRDVRHQYDYHHEQGHNRSFLERGTEYHPLRRTEETRRKNPIRKEGDIGDRIFNLTDVPLTREELVVLDIGLKYAPVKNLDKFETYISIQKYIRKLNIKKYLIEKPINASTTQSNSVVHSNLRNRSTYNPKPKDNTHIEVFKNLVTEEIKHLTVKKREEPRIIKTGIQKLIKRKDLVIRPSDKGGGIVIQTTEQYHKGMMKLLEDHHTYCLLSKNPIFK